MKKILISMIIALFFLACNEKEGITPIPVQDIDLSIELYGAFMGKYIPQPGNTFNHEYRDTLDYSIVISINGIDQVEHINKIVCVDFVGTIYEKTININKSDNLRVSLRNNIYPSDSYVFMTIFTDINRKARLELGEFEDVGIKITGDKMEYVTLN